MSDYTVVDKQRLRDYREAVFSVGLLAGVTIGSFAYGIVVISQIKNIGGEILLAGVIFTAIAVMTWSLTQNKYSTIEAAIENARGGEQ